MDYFKSSILLILILVANCTFAQKTSPVKFSYAISDTSFKVGDTVEIIVNLQIEEKWSVYSSEFAADGPLKFEFKGEKSKNFVYAGPIIPYKPFMHYDEVWEAEVKIFEEIAQFRIPIVIKKTGPAVFTATFSGQACKEVCVPISDAVAVDINTLPLGGYQSADPEVYSHYISVAVPK